MEPVVRKSISLPGDLWRRGCHRAKQQRRPFSNYIQVLIEKDLEDPHPVNVAFAPKPEKPKSGQEEDVQ